MRVIVWIPFNRDDSSLEKGWRYKKTMERRLWWKERAEIFERFTLRSLAAQTDQNFDIWIPFLPRNREEGKTEVIMNVCRKFPNLTIRCTFEERTTDEFTLEPYTKICHHSLYKEHDLILLRLDSDDMYHSSTIAEVKKIGCVSGRAIIFNEGLIYDSRTGKLATYNAEGTPPPFYGLCYPAILHGSEHAWLGYKQRFGFNKYHHQMHKVPGAVTAKAGLYCYLLHGENTSNEWQNHHTKKHIIHEINDSQMRKRVLESFGVDCNE